MRLGTFKVRDAVNSKMQSESPLCLPASFFETGPHYVAVAVLELPK